MDKLVAELQNLLPDVQFTPGEVFSWSSYARTITYAQKPAAEEHALWTLLHESSHALLGHQGYGYDFELLLLEVAAWEKAKQLAPEFGLEIDEDHIQDCLDTYRDWLHRRSTCPACQTVSLQASPQDYQCYNCRHRWSVTPERFCRPYRRTKKPSVV